MSKKDNIGGGLSKGDFEGEEVGYSRPETLGRFNLSPVRKVPPTHLLEHRDNDRYFLNDTAKEKETRASIEQDGIIEPIIALSQKHPVILSGHIRAKIAKDLQLTEVPVRYIEGKEEIPERDQIRILIDANTTAKKADQTGRILQLADLYPEFFENKDKREIQKQEIAKEIGISEKQVQRYRNTYLAARKRAGKKRVEREHIDAARKEENKARKKEKELSGHGVQLAKTVQKGLRELDLASLPQKEREALKDTLEQTLAKLQK